MKKFFGQNKRSTQAGLSIQKNCVATAVVERDKNDRPKLLDATSVDLAPETPVVPVLESLRAQFNLHKIPCVCVMEPGSYSLLQIESPNVTDDEMKSALHWKIKDLIDFHIDEATIDLFDMPANARSGAAKLLNVVVVRTSLIQQRVDMLHAASIEPLAIDITELALRNIAQTCLQHDSAPRAAMYLLPNNVFIDVVDNDSLYLSRNIENELGHLTSVGDGNGSTSSHEMLSLEMQRSMDFYESHYANGPATEMRIFQKIDEHDEFVTFARQQLAFKINTESLDESIPGVEQLDDRMLSNCLPAIGAALRAA